jgi:two-component sensor histidine kinase
MDVSATRKAHDLERAEHALLLEVEHRAKNALAPVQGVVRLSRRDAGTEAYAEAVLGRVDVIAVAHSLLSDAGWRGVAIERLVTGLIDTVPGSVAVGGPAVVLTADQVQPLAIVLHELLTNGAKHGALAREAGRCRVGWKVQEGIVATEISEAGVGRPTSGSVGNGFGKRIVEQVVSRQLRGAADSV